MLGGILMFAWRLASLKLAPQYHLPQIMIVHSSASTCLGIDGIMSSCLHEYWYLVRIILLACCEHSVPIYNNIK